MNSPGTTRVRRRVRLAKRAASWRPERIKDIENWLKNRGLMNAGDPEPS